MKTDYESIAFMFVKVAEALFMMAAKEQNELSPVAPKKITPHLPAPVRKGRGRPIGSRNWSEFDTQAIIDLWKKGYLTPEIAKQTGRDEQAVALKLYKLLREGVI